MKNRLVLSFVLLSLISCGQKNPRGNSVNRLGNGRSSNQLNEALSTTGSDYLVSNYKLIRKDHVAADPSKPSVKTDLGYYLELRVVFTKPPTTQPATQTPAAAPAAPVPPPAAPPATPPTAGQVAAVVKKPVPAAAVPVAPPQPPKPRTWNFHYFAVEYITCSDGPTKDTKEVFNHLYVKDTTTFTPPTITLSDSTRKVDLATINVIPAPKGGKKSYKLRLAAAVEKNVQTPVTDLDLLKHISTFSDTELVDQHTGYPKIDKTYQDNLIQEMAKKCANVKTAFPDLEKPGDIDSVSQKPMDNYDERTTQDLQYDLGHPTDTDALDNVVTKG